MHEFFRKLAHSISEFVGSPWVFVLVLLLLISWLIVGIIYSFTDEWQLLANTVTNIVTFLMVFLIQNTQNRDTKAIHLKLDEIIRSMKNAKNDFIDIEDMPDSKISELAGEFKQYVNK